MGKKRIKPFGVIFWALVAWAAAGSISHISLGHEWLTSANESGISRWPQALLGICLMVAAAMMRLSLISRNRARDRAPKEACQDSLGAFFTLIGYSAVLAGATFSNIGIYQGRWPDSAALGSLHLVLQYSAVFFGAFAVISTLRVATKSKTPVFKIPALIMSLLAGQMVIRALADYAHGTWLWRPSVAVMALIIGLAVVVLKVSFLTPSERQTHHVQQQDHIRLP